MRKRLIVLIVAGWTGFFVLLAAIVLPLIGVFTVDSTIPIENILPAIATFVLIAVPLGSLLFIPVGALITMTLEVLDRDGHT